MYGLCQSNYIKVKKLGDLFGLYFLKVGEGLKITVSVAYRTYGATGKTQNS